MGNTFTTARSRRPGRRPASARGFTLIEAALTTVIVGTGVLAIVAAQQAFHAKNDWAQRTGTAMLLANEIREMTLALPLHDPITGKQNLGPEPNEADVTLYDDLDDFAGTVDMSGFGAGLTFSPPIDALRQPVADMEAWTQKVTVENVLPDYISAAFGQPLGTTGTMRVTVEILYRNPVNGADESITSLTWLVAE